MGRILKPRTSLCKKLFASVPSILFCFLLRASSHFARKNFIYCMLNSGSVQRRNRSRNQGFRRWYASPTKPIEVWHNHWLQTSCCTLCCFAFWPSIAEVETRVGHHQASTLHSQPPVAAWRSTRPCRMGRKVRYACWRLLASGWTHGSSGGSGLAVKPGQTPSFETADALSVDCIHYWPGVKPQMPCTQTTTPVKSTRCWPPPSSSSSSSSNSFQCKQVDSSNPHGSTVKENWKSLTLRFLWWHVSEQATKVSAKMICIRCFAPPAKGIGHYTIRAWNFTSLECACSNIRGAIQIQTKPGWKFACVARHIIVPHHQTWILPPH